MPLSRCRSARAQVCSVRVVQLDDVSQVQKFTISESKYSDRREELQQMKAKMRARHDPAPVSALPCARVRVCVCVCVSVTGMPTGLPTGAG
jgi:hypothetical protein